MLQKLFTRIFMAALLAMLPYTTATAQESAAGQPKAETPAEKAETPADPFAEAKSFQDVQDTFQKLAEAEQEAIVVGGEVTMEKIVAFQKKMSDLLMAAADKLIGGVAENDDQKTEAYKMKIAALKMKTRMGGESEEGKAAQKTLDGLIETLSKDEKFAGIVNDERFEEFSAEIQRSIGRMDKKLFDEHLEKAKEFVNLSPKSYDAGAPLMLMLRLAGFSMPGKEPMRADTGVFVRDELIAFVKSDKCTINAEEKAAVVASLEGYCRRCKGAELDLYGKTLDDKDFDWKSYRGKYVLVKFTASWCGPCKGEIPGMLKAYEKYHDKGFDIVSVGIWDENDNLKHMIEEEKIPWTMISGPLTEKAGKPELGKAYAISGVPTMLLIDKDGKVLEENCRGPVLQKKLTELFPESR